MFTDCGCGLVLFMRVFVWLFLLLSVFGLVVIWFGLGLLCCFNCFCFFGCAYLPIVFTDFWFVVWVV